MTTPSRRRRHGSHERDEGRAGDGFGGEHPAHQWREVVGGEGADHEDVAVGEVDEAQHAVDHGVAEGDQGVDRAKGQAIEELLQSSSTGRVEGRPPSLNAHAA
jgi:hypothetical protein